MSTPTLPAVVGKRGDGRRRVLADRGATPGRAERGAREERRLGALHRIHALSAFGDTAGVAAACLLAAVAEPWLGPPASLTDRYRFAGIAGLVVIAVLVVKGVCASARHRIAPRVADDLGELIAGLGVAGICLLALRTIGPLGSWMPPAQVGLALATAAVVVPAVREATMVLAARNPANVARVVIVGAGSVAEYLIVRLSRSRLVNVVGIVDDVVDDGAARSGPAVLGPIEALPELCRDEDIDRIVIAFPGRHPVRSAEVLQVLRGVVDIDVVVRYYELANWESRLSDVTGLSLLSIGQAAGPVARAAKRLLDIVVAGASLLVLSPLLALVALAIRLESGSPVLFRQVRVGRHRRPFRIVKFRTMRTEPDGARPSHQAEASPPGAGPAVRPLHLATDHGNGYGNGYGNGNGYGRGNGTATGNPSGSGNGGGRSDWNWNGNANGSGNDSRKDLEPAVGAAAVEQFTSGLPGALVPWQRAALQARSPLDTVPDPARITRIGQLLRRSGLDELPQLFNVLRGQMSLVGPRPFIPEECASLHGLVERRFDVRPGMTGMWQVCGQHEVTFDELCRLDVQYATSWSLRGDLRILARTPGRLVRGSAPGR